MMRALLGSLLLCVPLLASAEPASNIRELLEQLRRDQSASATVNQQREKRFLDNKREQQQLVNEAASELRKLRSKADTLRTKFDSNETELKAMQARLDERSGDLKELFGVVRQRASDFQAVTGDSLVSAQFPERGGFLAGLASSKALPDIAELERLWFTMQQEMTESGRIVSFKAPVVDGAGRSSEAEVTRIGVFTAMADGQFLHYEPGSERLEALKRQPSERYLQQVQAYSTLNSGVALVAIDPTRGSILELLVETPTLEERVHQGGVVGYVILGLGAFGLLIVVLRVLFLFWVGIWMRRQAARPRTPKKGNPLGRVLGAPQPGDEVNPETLELKLDEAILRETPRLERGQSFVKLLAAVAPLLGLLGTVTGMIATFQSITQFGTSDPKLMAGGISQALVTTVLGLVVAIPLLFGHSIMVARSRVLVQMLDQQAAGLLARVLEGPAQPKLPPPDAPAPPVAEQPPTGAPGSDTPDTPVISASRATADDSEELGPFMRNQGN